jgi:hypothetical protein
MEVHNQNSIFLLFLTLLLPFIKAQIQMRMIPTYPFYTSQKRFRTYVSDPITYQNKT